MSLLPNNQPELLDEYLDAESDIQPEPSLTYRINFGTSKISGMVDEEEALKQFIHKALITHRAHFLIYSEDYGCELSSLIGNDVTEAYIKAEIPRMVREALIYDDRINDVTSVDSERKGDVVYITASVDSLYGNITQEVVI